MATTACSWSPTALRLSVADASSPAGKSSRRSLAWRVLAPVGLRSDTQTAVLRLPTFSNAIREGGVEPDLPEDEFEDLRTAGEDEEDSFPYGEADGHHTYHPGQDGTIGEAIKEVFTSAGGPTGFQAFLAWLTLPVLYLGIAFNVQVEYIFLGMVLFIFAFIGMEMAKPAKPHEYPPEIYRQLKGK